MGVVEEAIEERADGGDIAEELAPVLDRPVRAEQRADPLVAALDELEEVLGRGGRELPHAQVIDDEEGDGRELGHPLAARAGERGIGELLEQPVRFAVEHAMALQDERVAERLGEMTLARARRAEEDDVLARREEAAGGEREDEVAVHLLVEGEVEAVEGLVGIAKLGLLEPAGEEAVGAAGEFVLEEEGEEVGVGAAIGLRLDEPCLEARGDAAETEVAERVEEFRELHRHRLLRVGRDPGGGRGRG